MSAGRPGRGLVQGISAACADRARILKAAKDAPRNARYPSTGERVTALTGCLPRDFLPISLGVLCCDIRYIAGFIARDSGRVGIVGACFRKPIGEFDVIGEMPGPELLGMAGIRRNAQPELALRAARQVQHHDAVGGPVVQRRNAAEHALIAHSFERAIDLGKALVPVGVQLYLGIGYRRQRRLWQADFKFDGLMPR